MKMKYLTIFLGLVLCLLMAKKSVAQHCIVFAYDANGNRLERTFYDDCDKDGDKAILLSLESEEDNYPSLYPNPTDGIVTISIPDYYNGNCLSYDIYNMSGTLLKSGDASGNGVTIDIHDFPSGTYMFVVNCDDAMYSEIVVKL